MLSYLLSGRCSTYSRIDIPPVLQVVDEIGGDGSGGWKLIKLPVDKGFKFIIN